jgi:hypothetical protein
MTSILRKKAPKSIVEAQNAALFAWGIVFHELAHSTGHNGCFQHEFDMQNAVNSVPSARASPSLRASSYPAEKLL